MDEKQARDFKIAKVLKPTLFRALGMFSLFHYSLWEVLTEYEAFKVLLTMGHLSNQKDKTKVRRKNCCTFLEEGMSYGNGEYLPTEMEGTYLLK